MDSWLDQEFAVAAKNRLYPCLDRIEEHRQALLSHLPARWRERFGGTEDVRLYELIRS